jgi:hypothetical protein
VTHRVCALVLAWLVIAACDGGGEPEAAPATVLHSTTSSSSDASGSVPLSTAGGGIDGEAQCQFDSHSAQLVLVGTDGAVQWATEIPWSDVQQPLIGTEMAWVAALESPARNERVVTAVRLADGAVAWQWEGPVLGAAAHGDTVVIDTDEALLGLDAASGQPRWEHSVGSDHAFASGWEAEWERPFRSSHARGVPVVVNDGGTLVALDVISGEVLWTFPTTEAPYLAPVVAGDLVLHPAAPRALHVLDLATGTERWSWGVPTDQVISEFVTVLGDAVIVGTTDQTDPASTAVAGELVALDLATGNVRWARPSMPPASWHWSQSGDVLAMIEYAGHPVGQTERDISVLDPTSATPLSHHVLPVEFHIGIDVTDSGVVEFRSHGAARTETATLLDPATGLSIWDLHIPTRPQFAVQTGDRIALGMSTYTGSPDQPDVGLIRFIDATSGDTIADTVLRDAVTAATPVGTGVLAVTSDVALYCD